MTVSELKPCKQQAHRNGCTIIRLAIAQHNVQQQDSGVGRTRFLTPNLCVSEKLCMKNTGVAGLRPAFLTSNFYKSIGLIKKANTRMRTRVRVRAYIQFPIAYKAIRLIGTRVRVRAYIQAYLHRKKS